MYVISEFSCDVVMTTEYSWVESQQVIQPSRDASQLLDSRNEKRYMKTN